MVSEFKKFEKESFLAQTFIAPDIKKETEKSVTLIFVGDIMLDRGVEWAVKKYGNNNWNFPFLKIADDIKKADILFGNLEGPISDKGNKVGSIYSFRDDPKAVEGLAFAGFDIMSIANNHIFDYGREAMEDTFLNLKKDGIEYTGGGFSEKEAHSPIILRIKGTRFAFLAYLGLGSEAWSAKGSSSGIAWLNDRISEDIKLAKEKADLVVVSMHFGQEYQESPDSWQKYFSHLAIDSGADLVIGHHPHVIQPIEEYKGGYIAYSLGNFVFDQGFSKETMEGLLLEVSVSKGKIIKLDSKNVEINDFFQPSVISPSKK